MSAAERLDEYLRDSPELPTEEHYKIGDHGHALNEAEWAARKLAHVVGQRDDIARVGHAEIERIKAWMAGETTRLARDIAYFEGLLIEWHQRTLAEAFEEAGGDWSKVKGKTRRLPSGVVAARMTPERVEVDDDVFVPWAKCEGPDGLLRVKYEPEKTAIKEHVKETGEVIPGVTIVPGDVTFTVKVGTDAKRELDE